MNSWLLFDRYEVSVECKFRKEKKKYIKYHQSYRKYTKSFGTIYYRRTDHTKIKLINEPKNHVNSFKNKSCWYSKLAPWRPCFGLRYSDRSSTQVLQCTHFYLDIWKILRFQIIHFLIIKQWHLHLQREFDAWYEFYKKNMITWDNA